MRSSASCRISLLPELIDVLALDGHVMQKVIWAGMHLLFYRVVNWSCHFQRFAVLETDTSTTIRPQQIATAAAAALGNACSETCENAC